MSWRASEVLRKPGPGCVLGVVKSPAALPANFPREKVQGLGSLEVREAKVLSRLISTHAWLH